MNLMNLWWGGAGESCSLGRHGLAGPSDDQRPGEWSEVAVPAGLQGRLAPARNEPEGAGEQEEEEVYRRPD